MPSIVSGFEYDIFISYRHNDNRSGWVTDFVNALQEELAATIKEPLSIYFDKNPHDGLLETHNVDKSLEGKLKCLIFIPIISQTYCDPKSFAWQHEFCAFNKLAKEDQFGRDIKLSNGNVASRILPIKIHDLNAGDKVAIESELDGQLRAIEFIYREPGVNRPLKLSDDRNINLNKIDYRNQINKTANAISDLIAVLQGREVVSATTLSNSTTGQPKLRFKLKFPSLDTKNTIILFLLTALIVVSVLYLLKPSPEERTYKAVILPPENTRFNTNFGEIIGFGGNTALSPDGNLLAFVTIDSTKKTHLWVRPLNILEARLLSGTEGAYLPFWSPDSRFIGFFADGHLKKIDVAGGTPQTLCNAPVGRGGTWNKEGMIIFNDYNSPLFLVSASGGKPVPITKLDTVRKEISHRWPCFLPDGRHFLYTSRISQVNENAIFLASLDTTVAPRMVVKESSNTTYANGYLLFAHNQTLMAQPFDEENLKPSGEAFPIVEPISFDGSSSHASFSVSQNGHLVYQERGVSQTESKLIWYNRSGNPIGRIYQEGEGKTYPQLRLSSDGERIAVSQSDANNANDDIWQYEIKRGIWTRFTFDKATDQSPIWSPDGKTIVFASNRNNYLDLFQRAANGEGNEKVLLQSNQEKRPTDWSSDGKYIAYHTQNPYDIWILPINSLGKDNEQKPYVFLHTGFNELRATFSPDGRWIAYQSDESGRYEIYIRPFPGPGGKWQVSTSGGVWPRWRGDGKELFFLGSDLKLMSAQINYGITTVQVGEVQFLFDISNMVTGVINRDFYDVTRDGQRFLLESRESKENFAPLTLVVNWLGEIRKNN